MRSGILALTLCLLVYAMPATAQQPSVKLQFGAGLVTLSAQNASIRSILAEWARLGGSTIVNGESVAGPPVTLELTGIPERQAIDIVLRGVAGYMLAPRRAAASGASVYDRILILATSAAPRTPPPAVAGGGPRPGLPRPGGMPRPTVSEAQMPPPDSAADDADPANAPDLVGPQADDPRPALPGFVSRPGADPSGGDDTPDETMAPAGTDVAPTPANPFGIPLGSSATPGTVTPMPQPRPSPQR